MSYLVLKSCVAGGEPRAAGEVIELSEAEGRTLSAMGRVQKVADKEPKQAEDRSVGLEASTGPKLFKRGKKD